MANGLLGKAMTIAATNVVVYSAPANIAFATVSIAAVNQGAGEANLRVAISATGTPAQSDYIEFGAKLAAQGGVLDRSCLALGPNEKVVVWCDTADVSVRVHGLEEPA